MTNRTKPPGVPPKEIELVYRQVGSSHVFTAPSIEGFYYGSASLETTFNEAAEALSMHVSRMFRVEAQYRLGVSFAAFKDHLAAEEDDADPSELLVKNVVIATKSGGMREAFA